MNQQISIHAVHLRACCTLNQQISLRCSSLCVLHLTTSADLYSGCAALDRGVDYDVGSDDLTCHPRCSSLCVVHLESADFYSRCSPSCVLHFEPADFYSRCSPSCVLHFGSADFFALFVLVRVALDYISSICSPGFGADKLSWAPFPPHITISDVLVAIRS